LYATDGLQRQGPGRAARLPTSGPHGIADDAPGTATCRIAEGTATAIDRTRPGAACRDRSRAHLLPKARPEARPAASTEALRKEWSCRPSHVPATIAAGAQRKYLYLEPGPAHGLHAGDPALRPESRPGIQMSRRSQPRSRARLGSWRGALRATRAEHGRPD